MACIPIPVLPVPVLPAPLTIGITTPPISFDPALCCKLLPFPIAIPPIPIGISIGGPQAAIINAIIASNIATVQAYLDALPLKCPRE